MNEITNLVRISKYAGERFDLIQAGGGNSSVKLSDNSMLIKASGFLLSDLTFERGYAKVDNLKVLAILENQDLLEIQDKKEIKRAVL